MTRIPIPGLAAGQAAYDAATPDEDPQWKLCEEVGDLAANVFRPLTKAKKGQHRMVRDIELTAEPLSAGEILMPWSLGLLPISTQENAKDIVGDALGQLREFIDAALEELKNV